MRFEGKVCGIRQILEVSGRFQGFGHAVSKQENVLPEQQSWTDHVRL